MPRERSALLPLAAGSALIAIAVMPAPRVGQPFLLEWAGSLLAFYGLSRMAGPRLTITLAGAVLAAGSLGDLLLLGGLTPSDWALTNYIVFIHSCAGSLAAEALRRPTGKG